MVFAAAEVDGDAEKVETDDEVWVGIIGRVTT